MGIFEIWIASQMNIGKLRLETLAALGDVLRDLIGFVTIPVMNKTPLNATASRKKNESTLSILG